MGHHYVPRKLLRGFAIPGEPKMIWMYDKKASAFKKVSIASAAQEPKFYHDHVEKSLADSIEGPANPLMDKLVRREFLTIEERHQLSLYIALTFTRGPRYAPFGATRRRLNFFWGHSLVGNRSTGTW